MIFMIDGEAGQRQGARVICDCAFPVAQDPECAYLVVEWWGGPNDGDPGVVRINADVAAFVLEICD